MSTSNDDGVGHQSPPIPARSPPFKPKPLLLWASAVLALLLSISLTFTYPFLHSSHPLKPTFLHRLPTLLSSLRQSPNPQPKPSRPPCVLWMAPFLSGGGYSSEAWSYITALSANITISDLRLKLYHHGDSESVEFWHGLPEETKLLAYKLANTNCRIGETIVVCHSEPGAWYPPMFETFPCPPTGYDGPLSVVGRTMFETDRLTPEHVRRCNRMDAVWVPTEFHVSAFVSSGVSRSKVVKVVQPVDVDFFDPWKHDALPLPTQGPVLGSSTPIVTSRKEFVFLSIFKWEHRKGWDVLLKAYLQEFSKLDGVALYLLVNAYHSDSEFGMKIRKFVGECGLEEPADGWAPVHVIDAHVPQFDLPGIYKAADVFVLPSRGEGWGRPIVEAMAMALPVIATNWSGPTEYLTEENGYPLPVDRMSEVMEGPFKGHLWAEPSSGRLRALMRHVVSNPGEGRKKGRRARKDMTDRFSPEVVAQLVADEIRKISKKKGDRTL